MTSGLIANVGRCLSTDIVKRPIETPLAEEKTVLNLKIKIASQNGRDIAPLNEVIPDSLQLRMCVGLFGSFPTGTAGAIHSITKDAGVTRATPKLSAQEPVISPKTIARMIRGPLDCAGRPKTRTTSKDSDASKVFVILTRTEESMELSKFNIDGGV